MTTLSASASSGSEFVLDNFASGARDQSSARRKFDCLGKVSHSTIDEEHVDPAGMEAEGFIVVGAVDAAGARRA